MKRIRKNVSLFICVALFSVFALGSGSSDEKPNAEKVGEVSQSSASESDKDTNSVSSTAKEEVKEAYYVGDTFSNKGLNVSLVSTKYYISDNEFIQPTEGNQYIQLCFHVDNQSGSDKSVTVYDFNCYADGYECANAYFDDDLSASLSTGRSSDGAVYFEVPEGASEIEIEYEYDMFNNKKVKFVFEGDKESKLVFEKNTEANENAFHVGDIIETKYVRISYNKAAEFVSDNMFIQPKEGYRYIYIELEAENISDSDQTISYFSFGCYADGSSCDGFYGMDDNLSATMSAGRKAKGTIAYEVPVDAKTIEIEYEDNLWTQDKIIFLYEE